MRTGNLAVEFKRPYLNNSKTQMFSLLFYLVLDALPQKLEFDFFYTELYCMLLISLAMMLLCSIFFWKQLI